jgi:hypothetical protein
VDQLVDCSHAVTSLIKQYEVRDEAKSRDSFFESEGDDDEDNERGTYEIEEDEPKIESLRQSLGPPSEMMTESKTEFPLRQKGTPIDLGHKTLERNWLKRNLPMFRGKRRISSEESNLPSLDLPKMRR